MLKVVVIGYGDRHTASTRFRYLDLVPALADQGVDLQLYFRADLGSNDFFSSLESADLVINQKLLISPKQGQILINTHKPLLFDFDDALWTRPSKPYGWWTQRRVSARLRFWLRQADHVTVANNYLAAFAKKISHDVTIIPMALPNMQEALERRSDKIFTVGWMGAPGNLWALERLGPMLRRVFANIPNARLKVFCGKKPSLPLEFNWVAYDPGQEQAFARSLDVGLLPLPADEYSKGKSPIKSLFYMRAGAVVVGNIVGASCEILNSEHAWPVHDDSEWESALLALANDAERRMRMADRAKKYAVKYHSVESVAADMAALYKCVSAQSRDEN